VDVSTRSALVITVSYGRSEKLHGGDALMQQTISREEHKVQDHQPAETEPRGRDLSARGVSQVSHFRPVDQLSGGFIDATYGRFFEMPVAVVLTVLWLAGVALLSSCVLMLYVLGSSLVSAAAGA
jgi:hypothetical protein